MNLKDIIKKAKELRASRAKGIKAMDDLLEQNSHNTAKLRSTFNPLPKSAKKSLEKSCVELDNI